MANENEREINSSEPANEGQKDGKKRGRGWHGDSAGHAAAGRLGGRSRRKNTPQ